MWVQQQRQQPGKQEIMRPALDQRESQSATAHRSCVWQYILMVPQSLQDSQWATLLQYLLQGLQIVESSVFSGVAQKKKQGLDILCKPSSIIWAHSREGESKEQFFFLISGSLSLLFLSLERSQTLSTQYMPYACLPSQCNHITTQSLAQKLLTHDWDSLVVKSPGFIMKTTLPLMSCRQMV